MIALAGCKHLSAHPHKHAQITALISTADAQLSSGRADIAHIHNPNTTLALDTLFPWKRGASPTRDRDGAVD